MLEEYGARVRAVDSADAALRHPRRQTATASCPMCWSRMSACPAPTASRWCARSGSRPSERSRKLPAIAVTAYANPEDRVRALVAGYQNHVPKPVDANLLAAAIAKLVAG